MRIGLFGGTFNPVHIGHLRAAVEIREAFELDRLLLIPSARPPHKEAEAVAAAHDRLEMVRLALDGISRLEASDIEIARFGPSYTIDTLEYFQRRIDPAGSVYFIVGADAFSEITTWKSYRRLFAAAHFIVMARPGFQTEKLTGFIRTHISTSYDFDAGAQCYRHPQWHCISPVEITHLDISATKIRALTRQGRSISFLVPCVVEAYIREKGLYR